MLKIAVCDDNDAERARTASIVDEYFKGRTACVTSLYDSGQALLDAAEAGDSHDIYILDVIMPGMNGIETARSLRLMGRGGAIIYLTASPDYAVDSYTTQAFFYLLKPVDAERLREVLGRAVEYLDRQDNRVTIVNTSSGLRSIPFSDILYVERVDRQARYHLSGGETVDSRTIRCPFREATAPLLADRRFILCGVSFVVGLHRVKAIDREAVVFDSGVRISVSQASLGELKRAWMNYWLGGDEK